MGSTEMFQVSRRKNSDLRSQISELRSIPQILRPQVLGAQASSPAGCQLWDLRSAIWDPSWNLHPTLVS